MKPLKIFGIAMVVGLVVVLLMERAAREKLRLENESLSQQLAQFQTDHENFSNQLAQAKSSSKLSDDKLAELMKLRGEVGVLRNQTGQLEKVREENRRLRSEQKTVAQPAASPEETQQKATVQKMEDARQGVLAFIMFANDHRQQFPTNISQSSAITNPDQRARIEANFEILYQGSLASIPSPAITLLFKEKQAWQALDGTWKKVYGFADGHVEVYGPQDGNFDEWEKQRTFSPPANP